MRAALHLHLHYPDVARELVARVAALARADLAVFVTHDAPLGDAVDAALAALPGPVERTECANRGWDVLPFLTLLPRLRAKGYDVVGKLHTKKGTSGYAAEWRALAYEGMIASRSQLTAILDRFARDPSLDLVGPAALYRSAAANRFGNVALLHDHAPRLMAGSYPPADWGFFAGTFFWARTDAFVALERLLADADFGGDRHDGGIAHLAERLFGLAPVARKASVGLVTGDAVAIAPAPGGFDDGPLISTLIERAERGVDHPDGATAALIRRDNPLAHYARHGRDDDAFDPNPYFQSAWYNRVNVDVFNAGVHPLHHYMHHGWKEERSTGPLFDAGHYRAAYPDVAGDPLLHFMAVGRGEGRSAVPAAVPDDGDEGVRRHSRRFDLVRERAFLDETAALPPAVAEAAAATLVSIVMPVLDRESTIAAAIRSVLAQSHALFELIVVDDGSTDATAAVVETFLDDPRVVLLRGPNAGVSAARNRGLERATGAIVAYLDSDNAWVPWYLDVMVRRFAATGADAAYCGIALRDGRGHLAGYRGADFDWAACLERNYIDLNVFCHRRQPDGPRFDRKLRRMVDWDFILRVTRDAAVDYAPFVGCDYSDASTDTSRITIREPAAYQKLVALKNAERLEIGSPAFAKALRLSFAIKVAAPWDDRALWGDWHFAGSLAESLRRLGHEARVDCREQWGGHALADEDVAIVLRGLLPYAPRQGQIGLLWIISHPDQVALEEMERFARVYAAAPSHAALIGHASPVPVAPLLQATDPERFAPSRAQADAPDILFCGNSRGERRPIVDWAVAAGRAPTIYGSGWQGFAPRDRVAASAIDNDALGALYAGAGVVLNDHWPSMRTFGIVSNRLFDCAAAGAPAVSDAVEGIAALFGDAVAEVGSADALRVAVDAALADRDAAARTARARGVAASHGFDRRAETIVADTFALLGIAAPTTPAAPRTEKRFRVHLVTRHVAHGPQSSAYVRTIAPLTSPGVAEHVALTVGADADVPPCDVCIVQRTALPDRQAVTTLVGRLGAQGGMLVADVDDGFRAIDDDHPEHAFYAPLSDVLDRVVASAAETWFSTPALAALYRPVAGPGRIIPNGLDPRLWRDFRAPPREPFGDGALRLLYMGSYTHGGDFAHLLPALDALADERRDAFSLTLVGVASEVAERPWLTRVAPPADAVSYPRFVRWLRAQGPFDAGLAPLAPTAFNLGKSDVKLLDYAALGLLPVVEDCDAYRADPRFADAAWYARDWRAALADILDDRDRARTMAARARALLWNERDAGGAGRRMLARIEALRQGAAA